MAFFTNPDLDIDAVLRPVICKEDYIADLASIKTKVETAGTLPFGTQLTLICELFVFQEKWLDDGLDSKQFLNPSYHNLKPVNVSAVNTISTVVAGRELPITSKSVSNMRRLIDKVAIDIYTDDVKTILQGIFYVAHKFPRDTRGGLLSQLPWSANSWYLFDFLGAVFMRDDAVKTAEVFGGIPLVPYNFRGDAVKVIKLRQHLRYLTNFLPVVKATLRDVMGHDYLLLKDYFRDLKLRVDAGVSLEGAKLPKLPNLKALLWHSKQLLMSQRLLMLLPAVPGNSSMGDVTGAGAGAGESHHTSGDLEVNVDRYIAEYHSDKNFMQIALMRAIIAQTGAKTRDDFSRLGLLGKSVAVPYGISPRKYKPSADLSMGVAGAKLSSADRLKNTMTTDYFDITTLVGRLGLLRKILLAGEVFTPRNLGKNLKGITFISAKMIEGLRNGMSHIEDAGYFDVANDFQNNQELITKIFRELQTLKEEVYEFIVEYLMRLPEFADDYDSGFHAEDRAMLKTHWAAIKVCHADAEQGSTPVFCHSTALLTVPEITSVLACIVEAKKAEVEAILHSAIVYPFDAGRNRYNKLNDLLTVGASKDKKAARKLLDKAMRKYKAERTIYTEAATKAASATKAAMEAKRAVDMEATMNTNFPNIKMLAERFWAVEPGKVPARSNSDLFGILKDRLNCLSQVLVESKVLNAAEPLTLRNFQRRLFEVVQIDMALLLSLSYLVSHVVNLLEKLERRHALDDISPYAKSQLDTLIKLRNHLAHNDPLVEGLELPYYDRCGEPIKMLAVCVGNMIYHLAPEVEAKSIASLESAFAFLTMMPDGPKRLQTAPLHETDYEFAPESK